MRKVPGGKSGGDHSIYGIHSYEDRFKDFLSRNGDLFLYTLQEAKQLGLGIDLANASGMAVWRTLGYS